MKTVKEVAKDLGITTQSVYNKINKTHKKELFDYVKSINNHIMIDEKGVEIIKATLQVLQIEQSNNFAILQMSKLKNADEADEFENKNSNENYQDTGKKALSSVLKEKKFFKKTNLQNLQIECEKLKSKNEMLSHLNNQINNQIEDLKQRLDISQNTILLQQETIKEQQVSNNQQIEKLQILLAREQEKNIGLLNAAVNNNAIENNNKDSEVMYEENKKQKSFFKRLFSFGRG